MSSNNQSFEALETLRRSWLGASPTVLTTSPTACQYELAVTQDKILVGRAVAPRPPDDDQSWQLVSVVLETDGFRTYYWQRGIK